MLNNILIISNDDINDDNNDMADMIMLMMITDGD